MSVRKWCLMLALALCALTCVTTIAARPALANPSSPLLDNGSGPGIDVGAYNNCGAYSAGNPVLSTFNPLSVICGTSFSWVDHAKDVALGLFMGLLTIELIFIGIQHGLFKSDLSELFGSVAFKVVMACFMLWIITNADGLFESIARGFQDTGKSLSGTNESTPFTVAASYALGATGLIAYLGAAHASDAFLPAIPAFNLPFVDGDTYLATGTVASMSHAHDIEMQMMYLLAAALLGCAGMIMFQYILITAESYIIILGGIFMLGFAGSKHTLSFAQGYMSYAFNNGARLLAFYLVIGIEQSTLGQTFVDGLVAAGVAVATSSFSIAAADAGVMAVAFPVLQVVVMTSLVWFIPNLAGSFLSGNSSMTAQSLTSTMSGAVASASGAMQGLASAFKKHSDKGSPSAPAAPANTPPPPKPVEAGMAPKQNTNLGGDLLPTGAPAAPAPNAAVPGGAAAGSLSQPGSSAVSRPDATNLSNPEAPAVSRGGVAPAPSPSTPGSLVSAGGTGVDEAGTPATGNDLKPNGGAPVVSSPADAATGGGESGESESGDGSASPASSKGNTSKSSGQLGGKVARVMVNRKSAMPTQTAMNAEVSEDLSQLSPSAAAQFAIAPNSVLTADQLAKATPEQKEAMMAALKSEITKTEAKYSESVETAVRQLAGIGGSNAMSSSGPPSAVQVRFQIDDPSETP